MWSVMVAKVPFLAPTYEQGSPFMDKHQPLEVFLGHNVDLYQASLADPGVWDVQGGQQQWVQDPVLMLDSIPVANKPESAPGCFDQSHFFRWHRSE